MTCKLYYRSLLFFGLIGANFFVCNGQIFSDETENVGFIHNAFTVEFFGGGIAFFDYDNDGDEDIYVVGGILEDDVFINNGDGTFTELEELGFIGLTAFYNTLGVTTGDIDNDGDRDIFVATWGEGANYSGVRCLLFRNDGGGNFWEIGEDAGITDESLAMGATFIDMNKDGFLDIYVMNHIEEPGLTFDENGVVNGFAHECYPNFLYINNGDLTFTEVAEDMYVDDEGCSIAAIGSDYDMDGDIDLYVANDYGGYLIPNKLFQNNAPDEGFSDVSVETSADIGVFGMGIAGGDYDHDLDFDYYVTNIGRNVLCENDNGVFVDVSTQAGVENTIVPAFDSLNTTSWGTAFFDVNNDSWEDLFVANGYIPALPSEATSYQDPDKLFLNNGDKTFTDISAENGIGSLEISRGMAYSDFDEDGDLDVAVVTIENDFPGFSKFYVNQLDNDNNYIQFKLIGVESNRDAFGAKAWVYSSDLTLVKEIYGGGASYASQHSSVLHFGLGDHLEVDSVHFEWPNGQVDLLISPEVNMRHTIIEGMVTELEEVDENDFSVIVAPNPFKDQFSVFVDGLRDNVEPFEVQVFTMDGRLLWHEGSVAGSEVRITFDQGVAPGLYWLKMNIGSTRVVKKLVKI